MSEITDFEVRFGHYMNHVASILTLIYDATESEDWKRQADILKDKGDELWETFKQLEPRIRIIRMD